jgi:light-regulated signal transduction histidine kinase (bacteriophytochrome)
VVASQLLAFQNEGAMAHAVRLKSLQSRLLTVMTAADSYLDALRDHPQELCAITEAQCAAVLVDDLCVVVGTTPAEPDVRQLGKWLSERESEDVLATDHLSSSFEGGEAMRAEASGILAVTLSQVHRLQILWFRPEVIETVHWAGEPTKEQENVAGILELNPRSSFSSWKEIVRGHSHPWSPVEIESARDFRNAVLEIVLKRAEELADLVAELKTTNAELEAFSYSVSHDLRAPFRHISGFAELLITNETARLSDTGKRHLATIAQSAQFAGVLVDSLLNFRASHAPSWNSTRGR